VKSSNSVTTVKRPEYKSTHQTPSPLPTYENVIIGNFLVGFGLLMGYRHKGGAIDISEMCVSLTQQTPPDQSLGDLFLKVAGTIRVLEFKRATNKSTKERSKARLLRRVLNVPEYAHLESVSRRVHWYVETNDENPHIQARIIPYLDLLSGTNSNQDLATFVQATVDDACEVSPRADDSRHRDYFRLLFRCNARDYPLPNASAPSTGALIVQVTGSGQLRYAAVNDLRDIFLTAAEREIERQRLVLELSQQTALYRDRLLRQQQTEIEQDTDHSRQRQIKR
jgi:hypothetical protein